MIPRFPILCPPDFLQYMNLLWQVGAALNERFNWPVELRNPDLEVQGLWGSMAFFDLPRRRPPNLAIADSEGSSAAESRGTVGELDRVSSKLTG